MGAQYRPLTLHRYLYGADNPVSNVDPGGTFFYSLLDVTLATSVRNTLAEVQADVGFRVLEAARAKLTGAEVRIVSGMDIIPLIPLAGQALKLVPGISKVVEKVPVPHPVGEQAWMAIDDWIAAFPRGEATRIVTQKPMRAIRYHGGKSGVIAHWLVTENTHAFIEATGVIPRKALNIPNHSLNTLENVSYVSIDAGAVIYVGGIAGGPDWATQIWVRDLDSLRFVGTK